MLPAGRSAPCDFTFRLEIREGWLLRGSFCGLESKSALLTDWFRLGSCPFDFVCFLQ